jgi:hypothetical protein
MHEMPIPGLRHNAHHSLHDGAIAVRGKKSRQDNLVETPGENLGVHVPNHGDPIS